jgi:two-component system alkaline phosphatase synthesis response regulator PhoP
MGNPLLIVEDDPALSLMLSKVLELDGYDVTVVDHGRKALSALNDADFVAVVLDIMLPGVDGISILRTIREDPVMWSIPVVILTAKADDLTTWEGWKAGCDYYMTKPFDPAELAAILQRLRVERMVRKG